MEWRLARTPGATLTAAASRWPAGPRYARLLNLCGFCLSRAARAPASFELSLPPVASRHPAE